ncbi:unnamed protein product, partial [Allacma fusca]
MHGSSVFEKFSKSLNFNSFLRFCNIFVYFE